MFYVLNKYIYVFTIAPNFAAASLSSNVSRIATSEISGGKFAIRSRTTASLDAECSKSNSALISSSGSGGSPFKLITSK